MRESMPRRFHPISCLVLALSSFTIVSAVHAESRAAQAAAPGAAAAAGRAPALAPGTTYDPKIPTLRAVLGYDPGERITPPDGLTQYLKALHAAAPERTVLVEYGRTWEGRPLSALIVASPERIAALDQLKRDLRRLADPRGLAPADADALVARLPVVTWLMHDLTDTERQTLLALTARLASTPPAPLAA